MRDAWAPVPARWPRAQAVALFVRLSALGGTLVLPLVGAATAAPAVARAEWVTLVAAGCCFHGFAYVYNDVIDLPIDRHEPRRALSPLVRGVVSPQQALAGALASVPLAFVVAVRGGANARALAALAASFLLMAMYDTWGKRSPVPWLLDLAQGAGWAALVLFGAAMLGRWNSLTWLLVAYVTVFIVLANGVHGSLRDLANDARCGARSTAILMGATADERGALTIPPRVFLYGWTLHWVLEVVAVVAVAANPLHLTGAARLATAVVTLGLLVAASWSLQGAARARRDPGELRAAGTLHLLLLLTVPIALVFLSVDAGFRVVLAVFFLAPLAALGWLPDLVRWARDSVRQPRRTGGDVVASRMRR